jgi:hypothetical protein
MVAFRTRQFLSGFFLFALLACASSDASAQSYKAEALNEAPPSELSAAIRNALSSTGIRVTGPSGPLCDLWLGNAVPGKANAPQTLGVTFPQLAQGTLLGALRLPNATKDYRKQLIKAGVYTLRFSRRRRPGRVNDHDRSSDGPEPQSHRFKSSFGMEPRSARRSSESAAVCFSLA